MTKRLGERLVEAGIVSAQAVEQALSYQKITAHRLGDCLVELNLVQESGVLRFLAAEFNTRFATAEKLAQVKIAPEVLEKIPVRMAEKQSLLPIAFDSERKILSVAMAEPQNAALIKEIAIVTDMNEVIAFIATRSTIQMAIRRHYYRDSTAFSASRTATLHHPVALSVSEENQLCGESTTSTAVKNTARTRGTVSEHDYVETLNILVGMLESSRNTFRGHSAQVARQSEAIARRIGLQPRDITLTSIAAYLHDLGKDPELHLTLLHLSSTPEAKTQARRAARAPIRLFESIHLPPGVNTILAQLYEAFDGTGTPHGTQGQDISAGARIIAAVDAFFELTRNPANGHGGLLTKQSAITTLYQHAGTLFDPTILSTLEVLQSGELLKQRLEHNGRQIFVADPDEAVRTDLMDALAKQGLVMQAVFKLDGLIDGLIANEADTLVVSLAYGVKDIVNFMQFVRQRPESAGIPVLVLGDPTDPPSHERLVQSGIDGFIPLSFSPEAAANTIRNTYLDHFTHGGPGHLVRGSFDELAAPELLQLLGTLKKSGRLTVKDGPQEGYVQMEAGRIIYARFADKKGDSAIEPLLITAHADFVFDPEALLSDMPNADWDLATVR